MPKLFCRLPDDEERKAYLAGHTKSPKARAGSLPAHVREKKAKGRTYYYFDAGPSDKGRGRRILKRLPDRGSPDFAEMLAGYTLERWQRINPRITRGEVPVADARGDYLYFARCGAAAKIGRAFNVRHRIVNMQANNHLKVEVVCSLTGRGHEEKEWHRMFAADRIRGEWFTWTPRMAQAIDDARRGKKPWQGGSHDR